MTQPPRRAWDRASLLLGLSALLGLAALGCRTSASPGGFEDDLGDEDQSEPPDLPESECDPRRFDDCDEGQKCSHVEAGEFGSLNRCVPLIGEGVADEPCERVGESDTCASHFICWGTDADGQGGVCKAFCTTNLRCDGIGEVCTVSTGGLLSLCLLRCDPLQADGCAEGWGCYPDDYLRWACDRDQSGQGGAHGSPCACINCCDPGLICIPGALVDAEGCGAEDAAGCCSALCEVGVDLPVEGVCPSEAETCDSIYPSGQSLMGYDHVGVCEL